MSELPLQSLRIQGFRLFRDLLIPQLGRVNLIVGRNNTGKTSVLEALQLYLGEAGPASLAAVLRSRGEATQALSGNGGPQSSDFEGELLFLGRPELSEDTQPIRIAPVEGSSYEVSFTWCAERLDEQTDIRYTVAVPDAAKARSEGMALAPGLSIAREGQAAVASLEDLTHAWYTGGFRWSGRQGYRSAPLFLPAAGLSAVHVGRLWQNVALTDLETEVLSGLQIIAPEVERLSMLPSGKDGMGTFALVRLRGVDRPIPLTNMGDGITRVLHLLLALVNARGGALLIDEFENGIHYSVHDDLWRLLFRVAQDLDVQVFATTHSLDCVTAFQRAAAESPEEGVLIRLQQRKGDIEAVVFDEERLGFATEERIEVR